MSGDRGVVIRAEAGTEAMIDTVGMRVVTPTDPIVAAGIVGSVGAGKSVVVAGTLA